MYTNLQWSPDGREILVNTTMPPDSLRASDAALRLVNAADGSVRDLTSTWGMVGSAGWTPDGARIVFMGQPKGLPIGSKSDVWVIDRNGGEPECRSAGLKVGVEGTVLGDMPVTFANPKLFVTPDGAAVYVGVQDGGTRQIYRVALDGDEAFEPVVAGERSCLLTGADAQHLIYLVSDFNHPVDLYAADADGANERQLTHVNDELLAQVALPTVDHLSFPGSDGVAVEGWLVKPPKGDAPYPTILFIHGGPHLGFGHIFHFDTQLLCGAGYAVLLINHRASTGYGDEFATAIKGDWGNLDYHDLMAGVDHVIASGDADPDRLGVCGRSGGGNLSCWIVGHTDRFKAAVPENPVTNWVSFYGTSDIGVRFATRRIGRASARDPRHLRQMLADHLCP